MAEMTFDNAMDYLIRAEEALNGMGGLAARKEATRQFLDETTFKPGVLGASVLGKLDRHGFAGAVYPVNPNRETIGVRSCFASVDALPERIDVAVLAMPQPAMARIGHPSRPV